MNENKPSTVAGERTHEFNPDSTGMVCRVCGKHYNVHDVARSNERLAKAHAMNAHLYEHWPLLEANGTLLAIRDPQGHFSTNDVLILGHGGSSLKQAELLVRLFAAAPALLEACNYALSAAKHWGGSEALIGQLTQALAKVEGRAS